MKSLHPSISALPFSLRSWSLMMRPSRIHRSYGYVFNLVPYSHVLLTILITQRIPIPASLASIITCSLDLSETPVPLIGLANACGTDSLTGSAGAAEVAPLPLDPAIRDSLAFPLPEGWHLPEADCDARDMSDLAEPPLVSSARSTWAFFRLILVCITGGSVLQKWPCVAPAHVWNSARCLQGPTAPAS